MKTWQFIFIVLVLAMIDYNQRTIKNDLELTRNDLKVVDSLLRIRDTRDSLYIQHLRQCSFVGSDQLVIGYQGYLKVKN